MSEPLVKYAGDHRRLICYQKAELIYDLTYRFAHNVFLRGDRTIDQMVQAARSGKQNIVEGNAALATSYETGIKLLNVAKASLQELKADYEDFLRVNNHTQWLYPSKEVEAMRKLSLTASHQQIAEIAASRSNAVVANMVLVLLYQCDTLLNKLIIGHSERFAQEGGFREKMTHVRITTSTKKTPYNP